MHFRLPPVNDTIATIVSLPWIRSGPPESPKQAPGSPSSLMNWSPSAPLPLIVVVATRRVPKVVAVLPEKPWMP